MTLELREVVSVDIPAPLSKVWAYLRDPALVRRWYGWDHDGLDAEVRAFVDTAVEKQDVVGDATIHTLSWPHHDRLDAAVRRARAPPHAPDRHATQPRGHGHVRRRARRDRRGLDRVRPPAAVRADRPPRPGPADPVHVRAAVRRPHRPAARPRRARRHPRGARSAGTSRRAGPTGPCSAARSSTRRRSSSGLRLHGISEMYLVLMETPAAHTPPHGTVDAILSTYGARRRDVRADPRALVALVGDGRAARVVARQLSLSCHSPEPPAGRNPSATLMESM